MERRRDRPKNLHENIGNLEGHTHVQGIMHAQERSEKALASHVWLILRLSQEKSKG